MTVVREVVIGNSVSVPLATKIPHTECPGTESVPAI